MTLIVRLPSNIAPEVEYIITELFRHTSINEILYERIKLNSITLFLKEKNLEFDAELFERIISLNLDDYQFSEKFGLHIRDKTDELNEWKNWLGTAFFMLTRAEEYLCSNLDRHDRFTSKSSIFFTSLQYETPWVDGFRSRLLNYFEISDERKGKTIATYDIDIPFRFEWCNLRLNVRSILRVIHQIFIYKNLTLLKLSDSADNLTEIYDKHIEQIFFLMSNYKRHRLDGRYSLESKKLQKKIKFLLSKSVKMGWHAEYDTLDRPNLARLRSRKIKSLLEEHNINELEVRAHFLRWDINKSPKLMLQLGISKDYSMGFSDNIGFRAGTSRPFYYYDLRDRRSTSLKLIPLLLMDCALLPPEEITTREIEKYRDRIKNLRDNVKKHRGDFVFLWHNSYLETKAQNVLYNECKQS